VTVNPILRIILRRWWRIDVSVGAKQPTLLWVPSREPVEFGSESAMAARFRQCSAPKGAFHCSRIAKGTIVNLDEGSSWDGLHTQYEMKRINHEESYSLDCACTNRAEEFFSRMRRAEQGHHHHIAGPYLLRCARGLHGAKIIAGSANGEQVHMVSGLATKRGPSVDFCGYWQRSAACIRTGRL
jgi:ISXO2 transposase-like protein